MQTTGTPNRRLSVFAYSFTMPHVEGVSDWATFVLSDPAPPSLIRSEHMKRQRQIARDSKPGTWLAWSMAYQWRDDTAAYEDDLAERTHAAEAGIPNL